MYYPPLHRIPVSPNFRNTLTINEIRSTRINRDKQKHYVIVGLVQRGVSEETAIWAVDQFDVDVETCYSIMY